VKRQREGEEEAKGHRETDKICIQKVDRMGCRDREKERKRLRDTERQINIQKADRIGCRDREKERKML
jgi:hypothetical protein